MKVLVTGGAGFIGSHLVRKLFIEGHEVTVLDNLKQGNKIDNDILDRIDLKIGDVRDFSLVKECSSGCEIIFHLAAILGVDIVAENEVETMEVEVNGMQNVVNAASENNCKKIVYSSTSGVYGKSAIQNAVTEEYEVSPKSCYAIAKRYNEIYLKSVYSERKIDSVILRYFNVYGPKQDERMVIPRFFEQAKLNRPISIFGNGKQTRDFTFIDDVIMSTYKAAIKIKGCEIFNVSNEEENTIEGVAIKIKEITNSKSEIQYIESPGNRYDYEVERRFGTSEKLNEFINYRPKTDLNDGIRIIKKYLDDKQQ